MTLSGTFRTLVATAILTSGCKTMLSPSRKPSFDFDPIYGTTDPPSSRKYMRWDSTKNSYVDSGGNIAYRAPSYYYPGGYHDPLYIRYNYFNYPYYSYSPYYHHSYWFGHPWHNNPNQNPNQPTVDNHPRSYTPRRVITGTNSRHSSPSVVSHSTTGPRTQPTIGSSHSVRGGFGTLGSSHTVAHS